MLFYEKTSPVTCGLGMPTMHASELTGGDYLVNQLQLPERRFGLDTEQDSSGG